MVEFMTFSFVLGYFLGNPVYRKMPGSGSVAVSSLLHPILPLTMRVF